MTNNEVTSKGNIRKVLLLKTIPTFWKKIQTIVWSFNAYGRGINVFEGSHARICPKSTVCTHLVRALTRHFRLKQDLCWIDYNIPILAKDCVLPSLKNKTILWKWFLAQIHRKWIGSGLEVSRACTVIIPNYFTSMNSKMQTFIGSSLLVEFLDFVFWIYELMYLDRNA